MFDRGKKGYHEREILLHTKCFVFECLCFFFVHLCLNDKVNPIERLRDEEERMKTGLSASLSLFELFLKSIFHPYNVKCLSL